MFVMAADHALAEHNAVLMMSDEDEDEKKGRYEDVGRSGAGSGPRKPS